MIEFVIGVCVVALFVTLAFSETLQEKLLSLKKKQSDKNHTYEHNLDETVLPNRYRELYDEKTKPYECKTKKYDGK